MNLKTAKKILARTISDYDLIADHYRETRRKIQPNINFCASKAAASVIVDMGCGSARFYRALIDGASHKDKIFFYCGFDPSHRMVEANIVEFKKAISKNCAVFSEHGFANFPLFSERPKLYGQNGGNLVVAAIASFHHIPGVSFRQEALKRIRRTILEYERVFPETAGNNKLLMLNWNLRNDYFKNKFFLNFENASLNVGGELSNADGASFGADEKLDSGDCFIPWKSKGGETIAQRYYHSFALNELEELAVETGYIIEEQYFLNNGMPGSDGENIFSLWKP